MNNTNKGKEAAGRSTPTAWARKSISRRPSPGPGLVRSPSRGPTDDSSDTESVKERERKWGTGLPVPEPPKRPATPARNKNTPQPSRAASDSEESLSDIVSSAMTSTQVLNLLTAHGCVDITSAIDFTLCSINPKCTGGWGDIFQGRLRTGEHVAIKVFRSYGESNELTGKYQKRAAREIHTWSKCQHSNVVKLMGLTVFRECLAMVSAWEDNGNMSRYLSDNPTVNRCELSKSICAGISYLHSMDIVHGDLKGANVLIDHNGTPKLTDFGCAQFQAATLHFTQTNTGASYSVRWTAPEILLGRTGHTKEGDIYALGMTILEALTTKVPFSDRRDPSLHVHIVIKRKTPSRPETIIPQSSVLGNVLWALLMSCWSYNPARHPIAQAVHTVMLPLSPESLEEIEEGPEGNEDDD